MTRKLIVRQNNYRDSVQLMRISRELRKLDGVSQAVVAMGTDTNKDILVEIGLMSPDGEAATRHDMIIAIEAESDAVIAAALDELEALFRHRAAAADETAPSTLAEALAALPDANLCTISLPGEYAYDEARRALEAGLHVFIYSDNVPLEQDRMLKEFADSKGLLCMGPDCGVVNLNGIALGTASVAGRGPIGIVGASGSGTQQIAVLADKEGLGISQALGVGGKDLNDGVGGLEMLTGIDVLEEDDMTRVIVLVSRTPGPKTLPKILERVKQCSKPVVVFFIGGDPEQIRAAGGIPAVSSEDAAFKAVDLANGKAPRVQVFSASDAEIEAIVAREVAALKPGQRYVRGLFIGGTFAEEAMDLLQASVGDVYSNAPLKPEFKLADSLVSKEHSIIDLGEEEFTRGRAHPGLDPEPIQRAILREGKDPEMAVLLMDFILGPALNPDPAGSVVEQLRQIKAERPVAIVASVCGTDGDPQNLSQQEQILRDAGVVLMPSNAQAARLAGRIATAITQEV